MLMEIVNTFSSCPSNVYWVVISWIPTASRPRQSNHAMCNAGMSDEPIGYDALVYGLTPASLLNEGISPLVILLTNSRSGSNNMTWKCSTAFTDLSERQFLNQIICQMSAIHSFKEDEASAQRTRSSGISENLFRT